MNDRKPKIKTTQDLLLEIAKTQIEIDYSRSHIFRYGKGMFDNILTQSFNMISIAEVGYKIVRKLFSKGSEFIWCGR